MAQVAGRRRIRETNFVTEAITRVTRNWQLAAISTLLLTAILFATLIVTEEVRAVETFRLVTNTLENKNYGGVYGYFKPDSALSIILNGGGMCGEQTTVLNNALMLQGIRTRVVELLTCETPPCGHSLLEAKLGGKWRLMDPYGGVYYKQDLENVIATGELNAITVNPDKRYVLTPEFLKTIKMVWYVVDASKTSYVYIHVMSNGTSSARLVWAPPNTPNPDTSKIDGWIFQGTID
jgi:hypothetical protein